MCAVSASEGGADKFSFSAETTDLAPAALPSTFRHTRAQKNEKKRRNSKNMKHVAKTCVKRQDHLAVTYSRDNNI
jgi:hypothetical protein